MWSVIIEGIRHYLDPTEAQALISLGLLTTGSYAGRLYTLTSPAAQADVLDLLDVA